MARPGIYDDFSDEAGAVEPYWADDGWRGLDIPTREHPRQETPDPADLYELGQMQRADQRRDRDRQEQQ